MRHGTLAAALVTLASALAPAAASAQLPQLPLPLQIPGGSQTGPAPQPYGFGDPGGFTHIIPPGEAGTDNALQLAQYEANKDRPPHFSDQRDMYTDLLYASPTLKRADLGRYFKDATFGVRPGDVESIEYPRADVTIERDKGFGVPHIYGSTRSGVMFGEGYAAAEDRLFLMDVLRHYGAGELSSFAGGANVATDEEQWMTAPYTQDDLQRQFDQLPREFGTEGVQLQNDVDDYVAGINAYIARIHTDPTLMPAEYAAVNQPQGPAPWKVTDLISTASLIGAQLGNGGGNELDQAELLEAAQRRFGARRGMRVWQDLRAVDDPEAPVTATKRGGFPYGMVPRRTLRGSVALPDPGTLRYLPAKANGSDTTVAPLSTPATVRGLLQFPTSDSNALLISAKRSADHRPLAVFGSQAAYFEPEIYMEQDVHGPNIDARGAAFPGVSLYVELGRGKDYAWSATSASQDITDVYAVDLCNADGSAPTLDSTSYVFRGKCLPMEAIDKTISWTPSAADQTPAGSETMRAYRTATGIVIAKAKIHGRPVAYTRLRATYMHEIDSAPAFMEWNQPGSIHNVRDFQRAAMKVGYTFNWFYVDDKDIGYINTGSNPIRARGVNGLLPVRWSRATEWRGWDPATNLTAYQPMRQRPQAIDQPTLVSWNNKQAQHCCGGNEYTPLWRSQLLSDGLNARMRHGRKLRLEQVVDAMENAATEDLRGDKMLPWALRIVGRPKDPTVRAAVDALSAWAGSGAHRIDRNRDGHYDSSQAVKLMDAWEQTMPAWVFRPVMGTRLFNAYDRDIKSREDTPNTRGTSLHSHLGSAWEDGWFGFLQKDLRTVVNRRKVRGRYLFTYCGGGSRRVCRNRLIASLRQAIAVPESRLYADPTVSGQCGDFDQQMCFDAIRFRPLGAVQQPLIPWQNRPTQQQAVEVQGHR